MQEVREVPGRKNREASVMFSRSRCTAFSRSRATEFRDVGTPACTRRETVNRTREGKQSVKMTEARIDDTSAVPDEPKRLVVRVDTVQRITQWCWSGIGNHRRTAAATNLSGQFRQQNALL